MENEPDPKYILTGLNHRFTMRGMNPDELKDWRKSVDMTQIKLATHLGVSVITVSRWETGERAIPSFLGLALKGIECDFLKPKRKSPAAAGAQRSGEQ